MVDSARWPDRMRAADALLWARERISGERTSAAALLTFRRVPAEGRVRRALLDLTRRLPRMCERVTPIPLDIAPPEWSEDRGFDLELHFRRIRLAPPGNESTLCTTLEELLDAPLPQDRSPWRAVLLDKLAAGRGALLLQFHYAMTDGAGLTRIVDALAAQSDVAEHPFSLTPRYNELEALLWRAVQYNLEEARSTAAALRGEVRRLWSQPHTAISRIQDFSASVAGAATGMVAQQPAERAAPRRVERRTVRVAGIAEIAAAVRATPLEIVTTLTLAALGAVARGDGRAASDVDVAYPTETEGRTEVVDVRISCESFPVRDFLRRVQRHLARARGNRQRDLAGIAARIARSLPRSLTTALEGERGKSRPALHMSHGTGADPLRFSGQNVDSIHLFAPVVGKRPTVVAAHLDREVLSLGFDWNPHTADDPADVAAAIAAAWRSLRKSVTEPCPRS